MKKPPPLSPELEALLAQHRTALPLAPSVEARAIARAAAAAPDPRAGRVSFRPWFVFAAAAGAVIVLGAAAYAARAWISAPPARAPARVAPIPSPVRPPPLVAATPETEAMPTAA